MSKIEQKEKQETKSIQIVTFKLRNAIYGISVASVHEIIGMIDITYLPNRLPCMEGVINLRDSVFPVINLRVKFGFEKKENDRQTAILVGEVKGYYIGMIVDAVLDVVNVSSDAIQVTREFSTGIESDYIGGVTKVNEVLVVILDIDRLLSDDEMKQIGA